MIVIINADHRGRKLAKKLVRGIQAYYGHKTFDLVPKKNDPDDDYPVLAKDLCEKFLSMKGVTGGVIGILVCGSGIGMAMTANRNKGIRAASCINTTQAKNAREHQDANVLCLGADDLTEKLALEIIGVWIYTRFLGQERQIRRIQQMDFS